MILYYLIQNLCCLRRDNVSRNIDDLKLTRILMASTPDDHARTNPQQSAVLTRYDHFDAFKVTAKCLYTTVTFSLLFITFTLSARCEVIRTCVRSLRLSTHIYYICLWLTPRTSYHSHTINLLYSNFEGRKLNFLHCRFRVSWIDD